MFTALELEHIGCQADKFLARTTGTVACRRIDCFAGVKLLSAR